eukprot:1314143-Pleurochrysis_carterae.AAC.1
MSVLHASRLRDVQGADTVLSLRMGDVREVYIVALLTALPALYTMTVSLTDWFVLLSPTLPPSVLSCHYLAAYRPSSHSQAHASTH